MSGAFRAAYLHGFASGPASEKGTKLRERFAAEGIELLLPDLNRPSFERLTFTSALATIDDLDAGDPGGAPWRFVGSSMGGYLAARWAELHPDRVDRLVLLCPGFDMNRRWPALFGADVLARWRSQGFLVVPDAEGRPAKVGFALCEDALRHPAFPEVPCPTLLVHGTRDEVVPIDQSRAYAASRPNVHLVEVDDDHGLVASLDRIGDEVLSFWKETP